MNHLSTAASSRWTRSESFLERHPLFLAAITALLTFLVLYVRFGLWRFDLTVPFSYRQDGLYFMVVAKALGENAWNYFIPRLGAPFGLDAVDFPINCTLDFAALKLLMSIWGSPGLAVNLYWLLSVSAAGGFGALFLRFLRIRPLASITFGLLFGIAPFTFFRITAHLNLVTFIVPAGAYLAVALASGDLLERWDEARRFASVRQRLKLLWVPVAIALIAGLTYIYWPFFICIALGFGALIGFARFKRFAVFGLAGALMALIGLTATLNMAPTLKYWHDHGRNLALGYKNITDADTYGLRIRQMVTPVRSNGFAFMQRIRDKVVAAGFPEDVPDKNESAGSSLGTLGSIGLFLLVAVAVTTLASKGTLVPDDRLRILAGLTFGLVLICHTGGLGGLFNVFVTPELRCYNRVVPFISLFCVSALAIYFDRFFGQRAVGLQLTLCLALVVFGALDQITLRYLRVHPSIEQEYAQDRVTFSAIEGKLPAGTAVFQLPFMPFPLDSGVQQLPYYENAKAYLQTRTLRWSWGEMMGRRDWNRKAASLPLDALLSSVVYAGFDGLLISRRGYADGKLETDMRAKVGEPAYVSTDSRWAFYDLRPYGQSLRATMSQADWSSRQQKARFPIGLKWTGGFSSLEADQKTEWRWCGRRGGLQLANDSETTRTVELSGQLQQFTPGDYLLLLSTGSEEHRLMLGNEKVPFSVRMTIPPRSTREIKFFFEGPRLKTADPRELAFQITAFSAQEEGMPLVASP